MFKLSKFNTVLGGVGAALVAVAAISAVKAASDNGMDADIEWGVCPCVETDAAWSQVHGISKETGSMPFSLQSIDQNQTKAFARSTNDLLKNTTDVLGEIDVNVIPVTGAFQCSAYTFSMDQGEVTQHDVVDGNKAVSDCRKGLYNLVNQTLPVPGNS